ncbi:hypothetical protein ACFLX7_00620 [Chloroflexota bacterium]
MADQEVKSIAEQIVDDLFSRLEKSEVYNELVMKRLKEASSSGKLASSKVIIDAVSSTEE